jgi:hypothetical protein
MDECTYLAAQAEKHARLFSGRHGTQIPLRACTSKVTVEAHSRSHYTKIVEIIESVPQRRRFLGSKG